MAVSKLDAVEQYFDNDGNPLAGGLLLTCAAGTSTPLATYTDVTGTIPNSNPLVLDASGRTQTWWTVGVAYKLLPKTAAGVQLDSIDGILINAGSGDSTTIITGGPINDNIDFELLGAPPTTLEVLGVKPINVAGSFPANFSGSRGYCVTHPTASFIITVKLNGGSIGTITVSTLGVFTFATNASAAVPVVVGDAITCHAPVTVDATIANIGFTLVEEVA